MGAARTGAAHLVLPRTFQHHHADPGQSGGLPGEKGSLKTAVWGRGSTKWYRWERPRGRIAAENPGPVAPFVHAVAPDVVTKYARPATTPGGPAAKTWLARIFNTPAPWPSTTK